MDFKNVFNKFRLYIFGTIAVVFIAGGIWFYLKPDSKAPEVFVSDSKLSTYGGEATLQENECEVFVDVSGAVVNPNVYCFKEGTLVVEAVKRAGGFKKDLYAEAFVDSNLNLSRVLVGNEKLYIPYFKDQSCTLLEYVAVNKEIQKGEIKGSSVACVSINQANKSDLMELSGVGESLAEKIIDGRPYKTVEDLNNVSGIGDQLYEKLLPEICI